MPTTPQKLLGMRIDPPPSVPTASANMPTARPAAAPALLPPEVRSRAQGLRVLPVRGLSPVAFQPNSGVVVLPRMTAPCSRRRAVGGESCDQSPSGSTVREPLSVGQPLASTTSLTDAGTPSTSPIGPP